MQTVSAPLLQLDGVSKVYAGLAANDSIQLSVARGEIHAVVGENGAGKSTLMKIIYGLISPDAGTISFNGKLLSHHSPADAKRMGIGMVLQHFALFHTLTVLDNIEISLGDGKLPRHAIAERIRGLSERYHLAIEPHRLVEDLSVGERQRVEIIRCLMQEPKLIIMDEPTSVLPPHAVTALFDILRALKGNGIAIIYISHKLNEVRALADRATVLRSGKVVGQCDPRHESIERLAELMIGQKVPAVVRDVARPAATRYMVQGLRRRVSPVSSFEIRVEEIDVRDGEIVGIAGVSGNGQQDLLALLSGEALANSADAIRIGDTPVGRMGIAGRRAMGLSYVAEDRLNHSAVASLSLLDNAILNAASNDNPRFVRRGLLKSKTINAFCERVVHEFDVRTPGVGALGSMLSGGNIQKFIMGREILSAPTVLLVAQPTWGVDIKSSRAIYESIHTLRRAGAATLIVSDDLDELFLLCDRIAVLNSGTLLAAVPVAGVSAESIGLLMTADAHSLEPTA